MKNTIKHTIRAISLISLLLAANSASAIILDSFETGEQILSASMAPNNADSDIASGNEIIGGYRSIEITTTSTTTLGLDVTVAHGLVSHGEDPVVTGTSLLVWDGDNQIGLTDTSGLGGLDLTEDGGTKFFIDSLLVDRPAGSIIITVYDASDSNKFSTASVSLSSAYNVPNVRAEIPFSSFLDAGTNGGASFSNVGAITLMIDGSHETAQDILFSTFYTNGKCEDLIPVDGFILDECDVCEGPGPGECGCDLDIVKDECNVCNGNGPGDCGCDLSIVRDDCGECGGNGPGECGCNDIVRDECLICGGDGTSCRDCNDEINGTAVIDECGRCGGPGPEECGCDFSITKDACGICGGEGPGECGCDLTITKDDCGICGGSNKDKGCDEVCFSGKTVDDCEVCGGDSTSCINSCVEEAATGREVSRSKKVKRTAKVLVNRVKRFNIESQKCDGKDRPQTLAEAKKKFLKLKKTLSENITNSTTKCTNSVCTKELTGTTKSRLKKITNTLYRLAKNAKLDTISTCQINHDSSNDNRKVTEDYRNDVLVAINKLPRKKIACD